MLAAALHTLTVPLLHLSQTINYRIRLKTIILMGCLFSHEALAKIKYVFFLLKYQNE